MNTVLTIDTSSPKCAVALRRGDLFLERISEAERQSAQRVLPMISELLAEAGVQIADLDFLAVVAGPGSFTGVRIGVAVAQGLAMSSALPVVPLSSLALTAMAGLKDNSCEGALVCELAREGEVYFGAFRRSSTLGVELIGREQVALPATLNALPMDLQSLDWCLLGDAWDARETLLKRLSCTSGAESKSPDIDSRTVVELALLRFAQGEAVAAAQLRPNYVKEQLDYS